MAEPLFAALFEPVLALVGVPAGSRRGVSLALGFFVSTFALMVLGELARTAILMTQRLATPDAPRIDLDFWTAVYQAIDD